MPLSDAQTPGQHITYGSSSQEVAFEEIRYSLTTRRFEPSGVYSGDPQLLMHSPASSCVEELPGQPVRLLRRQEQDHLGDVPRHAASP